MWLERELGVRSHSIDIFGCEGNQLLAVKRLDVCPLKSRDINGETVTSPSEFRWRSRNAGSFRPNPLRSRMLKGFLRGRPK